jgi:hypothetical protein
MPKPKTEKKCSERRSTGSQESRAAKPEPEPKEENAGSEGPATPSSSSKSTSGADQQPKRLRRRKPGPPTPIGVALREYGLDEYFIARNYGRVVDVLTKPKAEAGSAEKLLVEVLKECTRQVEAAQAFERAPNSGRHVIVRLVHKVERPARVASAAPIAALPIAAAPRAEEPSASTPASDDPAPSS